MTNTKLAQKLFTLLMITLLLGLIVVGCTPVPLQTNEHAIDKQKPDTLLNTDSIATTPVKTNTEFTKEELEYIENLQSIGYITIATQLNSLTYSVNLDGSVTGFHYDLLHTFAETYNLEIKVTTGSFADYFKIDGSIPKDVETNPSTVYTPDLFNEAELYMANLTILPWRTKLMQFIKIIPSKEMIVTRKGETIKTFDEIIGKRVAVSLNTSHHTTLLKLQAELGTTFDFIYIDDYYDLAEAVSLGNADLTVFDSDRVFNEMDIYGNLDISMAISQLQNLSWAVEQDNDVLASILQKHLEKLKNDGTYNNLWKKYYHIDINDYLKIIDASDE